MQNDIIKIAEHFGINNQMSKCIEELSELIQAISKIQIEGITLDRYDNLIEEIVDVEIMVEQMKYLHAIDEKNIEEIKKQKIQRTIRRYRI